MNLLLDTHVALWWDEGKLPKSIVRRIQRAPVVYVSAASAWEIAIKATLGKIEVRAPIAALLEDNGFTELPVRIAHAEALRALPPRHRDPFDRLLVAQALVEGLTLVSADAVMRDYPIVVLWD